ncbi:MAG: protein kinase [Limnohabitans sp.]|nr:protein kinase [Limnohabitans sp.]
MNSSEDGHAPDPRRVEEIFAEIVELQPLARGALLAKLREQSPAIADEVESLLRYHLPADNFRTSVPNAPLETPSLLFAQSLVGQSIGGCSVDRVIGAGGMSVVYAATQDFPRRRVAVKVVRRERMSASSARRLRVEAEALARLEHPNIARVYAAGVFRADRVRATALDTSAIAPESENETPYIVLELVDGATPVNRWADDAKLAPRERIELVASVAEALAHAHRAGVIHRDLKPGNVIVGADGVPKIIDFGIAAVANSSVTAATEGPMGTLAYMSPEQARSATVDTRSDLWGLGALLYDLLAGCPPFDTRDVPLAQHVDRLLHDAPEPVSRAALAHRNTAFLAAMPDATDAVVAKALATDPERRYQSALEFASELRRLARGEPLLAKPDTEWDGIKRLCRRHRASLTAACGIAVAVVLALIVSLSLLRSERAAHTRAEWAAYLASIAAASSMLDRSDASAAREMLARAPAELRAWEWQHLAQRADQSLWEYVVPSAQQQVYGLDYAPDGSLLFGAASSFAFALDPHARKVLWCEQRALDAPYWRAKGLHDGRALFVVNADQVEIRDRTGKIEATATDAGVQDAALDRSRQRVYTNTSDGFTERSTSDLAVVRTVRANPPLAAFPRAIAVAPDASTVFLGDMSGHVTALDAATGAMRWAWRVPGQPLEVRGVAMSADGTRVAAVGGPYIAVLDAASGKPIWEKVISGRIFRSPSFTADGRELLVATWVETVDRYNTSDGRFLGSASGIYSQVWATAASPTGDGFAGGGLSARVELFPNGATSEPVAIPLEGQPVRSIALGVASTAGSIFATTATGSLFKVDRTTHAVTRVSCGFHANGVRVTERGDVVIAHNGGVAWLGAEGMPTTNVELPHAAQRLTVVDEQRVIVVCDGVGIGDLAFVIERVEIDGTQPETLASNQNTVVKAETHSANTRVWALPQRGQGCGSAAPSAIPGVWYLPSGSGDIAKLVRLFDARGVPLSPPEVMDLDMQPEFPITAALSPNQRMLAIGCVWNLGEVSFLDPANFAQKKGLPNHRGNVRSLAWSADSTRLASCATDDTLRIWSVKQELHESEEILLLWRGATFEITWANDGTLWAACGDGNVRAFESTAVRSK